MEGLCAMIYGGARKHLHTAWQGLGTRCGRTPEILSRTRVEFCAPLTVFVATIKVYFHELYLKSTKMVFPFFFYLLF